METILTQSHVWHHPLPAVVDSNTPQVLVVDAARAEALAAFVKADFRFFLSADGDENG